MARLGLYQPFIEDRNVRRLYRLKVDYRERTGRRVPMTALVNRILDDFFDIWLSSPASEGEAGSLAPAAGCPPDGRRR